MGIVIREERAGDEDAVREVNRQAFGGEGEGKLVDGLREGRYARVSLVAEVEGTVVGHILFSEVRIVRNDGGVMEVLSLAPMAVMPGWQRKGVGTALVREGLSVCRERGFRAVVVLGHPWFYPRFGFSAERARGIREPYGGGEAWMAVELAPGALEGVRGEIEYTPPFAAVS